MASATKVLQDISSNKALLPPSPIQFRSDRFIDTSRDHLSLIRIGEYVRTPLYEPSIRSMRLSLAVVRKQLEQDKKSNPEFDLAWKAATKLYLMRETFLKKLFKGPDEYSIALICYSLDEPYRIYEDFNRKCQQLMTDTWVDFPYKSLLYLLIQAETRMIINEDEGKNVRGHSPGKKRVRRPITITTDLDYSIEEEGEEEEDQELEEEVKPQDMRTPVLHTSYPKLKQQLHRVYRGLTFHLDEKAYQPRTLVAFSHLMPTTLDGGRLLKSLLERGKQGEKTTLLEIDEVSWSSRYVASLSAFPVEKEVVIWPWIKFYVEERRMIGEGLERILLKPTSRSFGNREGDIQ